MKRSTILLYTVLALIFLISVPEVFSFTCTESGYFGDPNHATKFYRCDDKGDGTFTQLVFDCGEGTVFNEALLVNYDFNEDTKILSFVNFYLKYVFSM